MYDVLIVLLNVFLSVHHIVFYAPDQLVHVSRTLAIVIEHFLAMVFRVSIDCKVIQNLMLLVVDSC